MTHEAIPRKEGFFERFQRGFTQDIRSKEQAIAGRQVATEAKRQETLRKGLADIAGLGLDPNESAQRFIDLQARLGVAKRVDASKFFESMQKRRTAGGQLPIAKTVAGPTGTTVTREPAKPLTESQFTAQLAKKVAEGTATEQETKVFGILQGPTSQITLNLAEAGKTAQEDAQIALTFQQQADELNKANPDAPFRFRVKTTTKGQRFLESEPKKAVAEGTANTIVQRENLLRLSDDIVDLYDPKFVGPIQGFLFGGFREKTGIGLTEREASFRTKVAKSIKVAYTDSGKQLSDKELSRLIGFLPTVNKVDLKFEAEMVEFVDEVESSLANAKAISAAGGRVDIPDNERRRTSDLVRERFNRKRLGERPTIR